MNSIRASLIVGCVLGTALVFTASGIAIYRGASSTLVKQLDENLADRARVAASVVKRTPEGMEVEVEDLDLTETTSPNGHGYLQLWLDADSVLYRSPRLGKGDLAALAGVDLDHPVARWTRTPTGVHVRSVDLRTHAVVDPEDWEEVHRSPPERPVIHIVIGQDAKNVEALLSRLRALLIGVGGLSGLLLAAVLAAVIRRGLRPLDELALGIGALNDDDLSARVRVTAPPREVKPVADQLNNLLARLEAAFEHERTFSSDIAHELRTPLAGLRSSLEVTLSRARDEEDYRATATGALDIVVRLQSMIETLLYLGRLESGQVEIERRPVDLYETLQGVWRTRAGAAQARGLVATWDCPAEAVIMTDPLLLEVAVRNIIDNAVAYADKNGAIRIGVSPGGEGTSLRIANSGSGIAQDQVADLQRRFTRADPSRRAAGDHFGLGLAITSKIAAALHAGMEIESSVGGEFSVMLRFQAA